MTNLLSALFDTNSRKDLDVLNKRPQDDYAEPVKVEKKVSVTTSFALRMNHYEADMEALKERYGNLIGLCIDIDLKSMLEICPRNRRRIEAYRGLCSELKRKYGCLLNIHSQKTKVRSTCSG